jgi:hypothetical protein
MNALKLLVVVAVLGLSVSAFAAEKAATTPAESPVFGGVGYTFWTDYGWRGVNMTQAMGGHRGTGASQMVYNLGMNVPDIGKVGVSLEQVYFNRFDNTDASLALTNINVYVTREIEGIDGKWTLGYGNNYWNNATAAFPAGDPRSQEMYLTYAWSDAGLWQALTGNETGNILNPALTYIVDYESAAGGQVAILSLNHPFNLADSNPELTGFTIVPTFKLYYDNRYYGHYLNSLTGTDNYREVSQIAYMDYGVKGIVDLTELFGLTTGKLNLTSGVGYVDGVEFSDGKWYGNVGMAYNF